MGFRFLFLLALAAPIRLQAGSSHISYGEPKPFSYDWLAGEARRLASEAYQPRAAVDHETLEAIDYDAHGRIRQRPDSMLWVGAKKQFAISFFHVGRYFQHPVDIHIVEGPTAREVIVSKECFDMPEDSPAHRLQTGQRVAGFQIKEPKDGKLDWKTNDWLVFLGASYFRSIGELRQYGISARGIAINTANPIPPFDEEFPSFEGFWIESPAEPKDAIVVYALLNGPSVAGAYRIAAQRKTNVITDVEVRLFVRSNVTRLGIAPLTSMYWYSETAKPGPVDWRPEIHDSDGLSLWTGAGERIWRPLNNPPRVNVSEFSDRNPRGFGLLQRDRNPANFLDGVAYERRPTLWVEPQGEWGDGAVQLVEIPTNDEAHDNIVAFWTPRAPVKAGAAFDLKYRLHWNATAPFEPDLARVTGTRLGRAGETGQDVIEAGQRFVIEFEGPSLELPKGAPAIEASLTTSRGKVANVTLEPSPGGKPTQWLCRFDVAELTGPEAVELRASLRSGGKLLTETWNYQFWPARK